MILACGGVIAGVAGWRDLWLTTEGEDRPGGERRRRGKSRLLLAAFDGAAVILALLEAPFGLIAVLALIVLVVIVRFEASTGPP
jgi:hypothetical protein